MFKSLSENSGMMKDFDMLTLQEVYSIVYTNMYLSMENLSNIIKIHSMRLLLDSKECGVAETKVGKLCYVHASNRMGRPGC